MAPNPIYLSINDKPQAVVSVMDGLVTSQQAHQERHRKQRWLPLVLLLASCPFIAIDAMMGYNVCTFSLVALALIIGALVIFITNYRNRPGQPFPSQYQSAREILYTLRDDLHPSRNFFGHLDLTGPEQESKLHHEAPNMLGLAVQHYRDEWLNLKGKLYDGNMLRLELVNRHKVRKGYYKRGSISGKQKWQPPRAKEEQELKISLTVNPDVYSFAPQPAFNVGSKVGPFTVTLLDSSSGIIRLAARAPEGIPIQAAEVLAILRSTYTLLQRKS